MILIFIISCTAMACSQNQKLGPGYQFDLFKNTPNWELAKAVDIEDTVAIKKLIKDDSLDINLQEPRFGNTLLCLAVENDKLISTKALLEMGANLNIANFEKYKPIHEATRFISLKKNTLQILKLLIHYGANVNDTLVQRKGSDTVYFEVPLMNACQNLACAKLLLEHGANVYIKNNNSYPIWFVALIDHFKDDEGIYFVKYVVIDKKMPIPDPIAYSLDGEKPINIFNLLADNTFKEDIKRQKARQDILDYLKQIDFPKKGVYREKE